ncbi:dynein heavy chain [Culex quinquefasciatus]|uniref:Dynein heavy chain n=1 Tax=Culex quinquefasciatus TaxID=7176 RepID=B0WR50_CULQU|nr:dynein heavy chain [Culex quinquefasciatus]|eukprot:XP_001851184.1 dynein heavy chain [Culex quinquefasciatus]
MSTIFGDLLPLAAFTAYGSFFDQHYRPNICPIRTNVCANKRTPCQLTNCALSCAVPVAIDQNIDLSPSFVIFLLTRDSTVDFPPEICSRVTFVNFTMRRSSLQSKCLNHVLKSERPGSYLLKLQGMFHLRLRQLEKSLLQSLNDAKGKILNDESVITTLETLKKEAAAVACSNNYDTMDSLNQVHFLYQYSLKMFLDIFRNMLNNNQILDGKTNHTARLLIISSDLYTVCYHCVARGMMHAVRLAFAILLCRIYLEGTNETNLDQVYLLSAQQGRTVCVCSCGRIRITRAELPPCRTNPKPVSSSMHQLLHSNCVAPSVCVDRARGTRYGQCRKGAQLYCLCGEGTHIHTPALLCSVIGNDASSRAADLAAELNKQISSIAIGSAEGFNQVVKAINKACKTRRWMLPRTSTWPRDGSSNSRGNCTRYSPLRLSAVPQNRNQFESSSIYGGKIESDFDQRFESEFALNVDGVAGGLKARPAARPAPESLQSPPGLFVGGGSVHGTGDSRSAAFHQSTSYKFSSSQNHEIVTRDGERPRNHAAQRNQVTVPCSWNFPAAAIRKCLAARKWPLLFKCPGKNATLRPADEMLHDPD